MTISMVPIKALTGSAAKEARRLADQALERLPSTRGRTVENVLMEDGVPTHPVEVQDNGFGLIVHALRTKGGVQGSPYASVAGSWPDADGVARIEDILTAQAGSTAFQSPPDTALAVALMDQFVKTAKERGATEIRLSNGVPGLAQIAEKLGFKPDGDTFVRR